MLAQLHQGLVSEADSISAFLMTSGNLSKPSLLAWPAQEAVRIPGQALKPKKSLGGLNRCGLRCCNSPRAETEGKVQMLSPWKTAKTPELRRFGFATEASTFVSFWFKIAPYDWYRDLRRVFDQGRKTTEEYCTHCGLH